MDERRSRGNGQLKPAFNLQHRVDSEYIVWLTIGPQPTDTATRIPFLRETEEYLAFIKPSNYEIPKKRKYKNDIGRIENINYDEKSDSYICRNEKILSFTHVRRSISKTGYASEKKSINAKNVMVAPIRKSVSKETTVKLQWKNEIK